MRATFILLSKLAPGLNQSPPEQKWKFQLDKKRTPIVIQVTPKIWLMRMLKAPNRVYYYWVGIIAIGGIASLIVQHYYNLHKLRTSDFSLTAFQTLQNYPALIDIIGPPLRPGHVFPSKPRGIQDDEVHVNVPITGEKSKGILSYHSIKVENRWIIRSMEFSFCDRAGGIVRLVKDPTSDVET